MAMPAFAPAESPLDLAIKGKQILSLSLDIDALVISGAVNVVLISIPNSTSYFDGIITLFYIYKTLFNITFFLYS